MVLDGPMNFRFALNIMAVRKRLVDLTINELKAVLKKKGLSEFGDRNELLMRLRQAVAEKQARATHSSVTTDGSGTQDEKTASTNDERNTCGMVEKVEELDLEVMLEEIEGGGGRGGGDDGKEGVSSTPGASGENRGERKERLVEKKTSSVSGSFERDNESGEKPISKETARPATTLWISGLSSTAKATDLKQLFSQHGQVNGAKVVASSKSESKRFGIVTMSTADQAQACIENVNNTEFLDNLITVELDPKQRTVGESSHPVTETDSKQDDLASSASLWISGLTTTTKAADLKEMCIKYGEVVQAKVVASAKNPDSKRYYGIVTMSTSEEADRCIENLNQTEVNGQVITVEKRKQDSTSKMKSSSKSECSSSSFDRRPFDRKPFERGRFSGSRGFRGRSFPARPFMDRGRNSGYRGRGRDAFTYMDQIRADYERQMFHEQRMREGGDHRNSMPEFRGGRGRFPGRSRPPFERSWNDRRGGFRRGTMNHEPYWGQAAKRPRMDDQKTEEAGQFGESGNRLPAESGGSGGGGKWNSGYQGDKDQTYCEPYNVTSQDKGFGTKSNWEASDANTNKKGNSGSSYNQWQSGGADSTTNTSGTYQADHVMYSSYSATQSYSSGLDTSAGGSYMGAGSSSYPSTTGTSTYGTAGSNLYGNTGSSYSGKESGSYGGTVTSVYSSAGSGSYGGAGSSSYAASGNTSYPTTGSGSYQASGSGSYLATGSSSYPTGGNSSYGGATGSSYGGATGTSYGGATVSSYGAAASSSYPPTGTDAYGIQDSSYGGTYTSSYPATASGSYGSTYVAPVTTTYSATSVSYQGTGSYAAQQGVTSYGGTSMYAAGAAYAGNAGSTTGTVNSQAQYDTYKPQGSSQAYSWYGS